MANAFESASDVVNARLSQNMFLGNNDVSAGSTLKAGVSTAGSVMVGAASAGKSVVRHGPQTVRNAAFRVAHFVHTMITLFTQPIPILLSLLPLVNVKMVLFLLVAQVGCSARNLWGRTKMSIDTVFNELTTFNQFQFMQPITLIHKLKKLFDSMQESNTAAPTPPRSVVYRETRLGPYLLDWLTKLGGTYFVTQNGWYILKQLSFAFTDGTKRIRLKKEAIDAVVSALSNPLSLDELLDSTEEAVEALTGNDKIRKKQKALKAS